MIVQRAGALRRPRSAPASLLYRWGDLGARCSNHNGIPDTEDLDGDNVLDAQGPNDDVFRYVVDLADREQVLRAQSRGVRRRPRATRANSATWTIYRVPLRQADDTIGNRRTCT